MFFLLRALIGVAESRSADDLSQLVNASGVNLLLSDLLTTNSKGTVHIFFSSAGGSEQAHNQISDWKH